MTPGYLERSTNTGTAFSSARQPSTTANDGFGRTSLEPDMISLLPHLGMFEDISHRDDPAIEQGH
jgi:hypothetical protein